MIRKRTTKAPPEQAAIWKKLGWPITATKAQLISLKKFKGEKDLSYELAPITGKINIAYVSDDMYYSPSAKKKVALGSSLKVAKIGRGGSFTVRRFKR